MFFYANIYLKNSYSSVLTMLINSDFMFLPLFVEPWTKNCCLLSPPTTVNFPMSSVEGKISLNCKVHCTYIGPRRKIS